MRKYLKQMGIPSERLRLEWISASEGVEFAQLVNEFTETIKSLEPSKIKKSIETFS
jgi:F420-non-reducing hydrogenase iron-sulfur subunit